MEFIRGIHNLKSHHYGCILTIGNFDGFHRGHQALIADLKAISRSLDLPVMVMIFEPQPKEHFYGSKAPARLTSLREKLKYLSEAGVSSVICISFNEKFASLSASDFVKKILVQKLGVRFVGVGDDFRFGTRRQGDYFFLKKKGKSSGFKVMKAPAFTTESGQRISSSIIREMLTQDRLIEAEILLGHSYRLSGRVVHGNAVGKLIGFPTANLALKKIKTPINGVYIVKVYGIGETPLPGVANIGTRPTINGTHQRLEVHLLGVVVNLYGHYIDVVILTKVRNEKRFDSISALQQQIKHDVLNTYKYFGLESFQKA